MTTDESLKQYGLIPSEESLPAIRQMLGEEAANERCGRPREDDLALLCCVQLFSRGLLEDVLRIWEAKRSGMDLGCVLDVEFLCGAGFDKTKHFLAEQQTEEAAEALSYICKCESHFADFTPQKHLEHYKRYFNVA